MITTFITIKHNHLCIVQVVPDYYEIIKLEDARWLNQIQETLTAGKYTAVGDYEADVARLFQNYKLYNTPDTGAFATGMQVWVLLDTCLFFFGWVGVGVGNLFGFERFLCSVRAKIRWRMCLRDLLVRCLRLSFQTTALRRGGAL